MAEKKTAKDLKLEECKTFCNEGQIFPAMVNLVEKEKFSVRAASKEIERVTNGIVTAQRARRIYQERKPAETKKETPEKKKKAETGPNGPKTEKTEKPATDPAKTSNYTQQFENAFDAFYRQVQQAKAEKWENTSKEAVLFFYDKLLQLVGV